MTDSGKTWDSPSAKRSPSECDRKAWARLAARYLRDLPEQLSRIRTTLAIRDYSTIKKQAHRIKGTSGTYRFDAISRTAAKLERLADSRDPDAIAGAISRAMHVVELETRKLNSRAVSSLEGPERSQNG